MKGKFVTFRSDESRVSHCRFTSSGIAERTWISAVAYWRYEARALWPYESYTNINNHRDDRGDCDSDRWHIFNLTGGAETPQFANPTMRTLATELEVLGNLQTIRRHSAQYSRWNPQFHGAENPAVRLEVCVLIHIRPFYCRPVPPRLRPARIFSLVIGCSRILTPHAL